MVLKRQEKENVIKAIYDSSNILASTYNRTTNELILIFNKGSQYKYPNVSVTDYTRFELAESQGKVFNTHIKNYSFEKLESVNPELIVSEISTLKDAEDIALLEGKQLKVETIMRELLSLNGDEAANLTLFTEAQLKKLQDSIVDYVNVLTTK